MEFPKNRIEYSLLYGGKKTEKGWLILNLKGLDIEGVNELALDVEAIKAVLEKGGDRSEHIKRARQLLGSE